ncbi:hypothetical protein ACWCV5_33855 [Streptomyces tubercidicus]
MSDTTVRVDSLPDAAVALLRAVHDALNVPLPGLADEDESEYAALLQRRSHDALAILGCVLEQGHDVAFAAGALRRWTADRPVTYTPWTDNGGAV